MKNVRLLLCFTVLLLTGFSAGAQNLLVPFTPVQKIIQRSGENRAKETLRTRLYKRLNMLDTRQQQLEGDTSALTDTELFTNEAEVKTTRKVLDSLDKPDMADVLAALNKLPQLTVSGVGGISELQSPAQAGGNFSVATTFRLNGYRQMGNSQWVDPGFLYMAFNTRTGGTQDTEQISKAFLFPDISKRDFVLGVYWHFLHPQSGWAMEPIAEFSLNRYKTTIEDTITRSFTSESALLGVRFSKTQLFGTDSTFEAGFVLFPYYSIINVQPKNFDNYNLLMKGSHLPPTVHAIGLQAILQLSRVQLFANAKYILNRNKDLEVDDLKGFTYTIGTMIGVDVLKFRLTGS